jgi:hypothetical protein
MNDLFKSEVNDKALELGFSTRDLGDTFVGSQRQLLELVKYFLEKNQAS